MSENNSLKIKQIRFLILGNLNRLYPMPFKVISLYRILTGFDETYDFSLYTKDIYYLKQKNLIEFIDDKIGGFPEFKEKYIGLTFEGKEIADRIMNDPALEL